LFGMSNGGEVGELVLKARILLAMYTGEKAGAIGKVIEADVGDLRSQRGSYKYPLDHLPQEISEVCEDSSWSTYAAIRDKLEFVNINKASSSLKADVRINNVYYSVKSSDEKPAVVNHTKRSGFLNVSKLAKCSIDTLDANVVRYWNHRLTGKIGEDVGPASRKKHSIFWEASFKEQFRPIFNYFAFDGTGRGASSIPAQMVLEFEDPRVPSTWKVHSKHSYYDACWPKLVFSLRNHRQGSLKPEDKMWVRNCNGKARGQLHIRVS